MKVIQVLNHFLPQQTAGTEIYVQALSAHLIADGLDVHVLIPHLGSATTTSYVYKGLRVVQYAEPSVPDRSLLSGRRAPEGLATFRRHLEQEHPDVVHFHEFSHGTGITRHHIAEAKATGARVVLTLHLAGYVCKTASLVQNGVEPCDGLVIAERCSVCHLTDRGFGAIARPLTAISSSLDRLGVDPLQWNNLLGTALGTTQLIRSLIQDLHFVASYCDRVVVLTEWYRHVLALNGIAEGKLIYIPQGLPFPDVPSAPISRPVQRPIRLVSVGRINELKGIHQLLSAVMRFDASVITLDLYGGTGGTDFEREWMARTEDHSNIRWMGRLSPSKVVSTLEDYDVFCLCSTTCEMSPLVIQEAFAAGLPVIASDSLGNREQIEDDINGLIYEFKSADSLYDHLLRCVEKPSILDKLRNSIPTPRSFDQVSKEYATLYEEVT